jgi:hypothetical protein
MALEGSILGVPGEHFVNVGVQYDAAAAEVDTPGTESL